MDNQQHAKKRRRKKKKENSVAKRIIPVLIAIVLIIVVVATTFGKEIIDKYSYSSEEYDMTVYFENKSDSDVAIILQDKFMEDRAYYLDGTYYVDYDFALTHFNDRFYYDSVDRYLIYTLPTDMIINPIGTNEIRTTNGTSNMEYDVTKEIDGKLLVALDYLKKYSNFSYEAFEEPRRLQIYTEWNERSVATVKKKSAVRHKGGIKEEILEEVDQGDKLYVLEQMEEWSKVKTNDAVIGYIENKHLMDITPELPIPVTDYTEPEYTNLVRDHKINMGWHAVAGVVGNDTLETYVNNTEGLNVVSPTWFNLCDSEGNYESFATQTYVDKAHAMGLEVWPTFNNTEHYKDVNVKDIIDSTTERQALIQKLMNDILSMGIDGINIDIEMLPTEAGRDFSEFIRELSIECRKNNVVLSIDNYVPIGNTGYYDRKTQGEVADYVVIMGYDEHYAGSQEAGSVASIGYVETGITNTLEEVPAYKVINAIPFYTRIWEINGADVSSQAVGMETANEWIAAHNVNMQWDEKTCQNYGEYTSGETTYKMWAEDADSIKVKLNVMAVNNLAGVAEWRLGYETKDIWDVILEYLNN